MKTAILALLVTVVVAHWLMFTPAPAPEPDPHWREHTSGPCLGDLLLFVALATTGAALMFARLQ